MKTQRKQLCTSRGERPRGPRRCHLTPDFPSPEPWVGGCLSCKAAQPVALRSRCLWRFPAPQGSCHLLKTWAPVPRSPHHGVLQSPGGKRSSRGATSSREAARGGGRWGLRAAHPQSAAGGPPSHGGHNWRRRAHLLGLPPRGTVIPWLLWGWPQGTKVHRCSGPLCETEWSSHRASASSRSHRSSPAGF